MEKIVVQAVIIVWSEVTIEGAKNAVYSLLAATILASKGSGQSAERSNLAQMFHHETVSSWSECQGDFDMEPIFNRSTHRHHGVLTSMSADACCPGTNPAVQAHAKVSMPGMYHRESSNRPPPKVWKLWGAKITQTAGHTELLHHLHGAHIYMDFPSVGDTKPDDGSTLADGQ